jgi:hypothetical protein
MNDKEATPAEPEVLWSCPETSNGRSRFTRENGWEWYTGKGGGWVEHPQSGTLVYQELARRLLAERAEQEKLDDHNDSLEEAARIARIESRLWELDKNLAREVERRALETKEQRRNCATYERVQADLIAEVEGLKAAFSRPGPAAAPEAPLKKLYKCAGQYCPGLPWPPSQHRHPESCVTPPPSGSLRWERGANRMVNSDGVEVLDLGDCDNLRPEEHAWLSRLADLWCAWGSEGYLRELLVGSRYSGADTSEGVLVWFRRLRSELLARPWKEGE